MPDQLTATNTDAKFNPHPEGQYAARCVDVVDLGEKVEQYPGFPERLSHKCLLIFRTGRKNEETGEFIDIAKEFTVSMGEKANLRKALEDWRGKSYTPAQVEEGVPLHKLTGQPALITVEHKRSQKGRTYANMKGIAPLPPQMASMAPSIDGYKRAEYIEERKKTYAQESQEFRKAINAPPPNEPPDDDYPGQSPDDDADLPF